MVALIGDEAIEYLQNLKSQIEKNILDNPQSFEHFLNSQMRELIEAEQKFMGRSQSIGSFPTVGISLNGLPSVPSLQADLEQMCKLKDDFADITGKFTKGMTGKNRDSESQCQYTSVSHDEWTKVLGTYERSKLKSEIGFAFKETDDKKFELSVREDLFVKGYDPHSREFPVLIREGKIKYQVVWNKLLSESQGRYFVPRMLTAKNSSVLPKLTKKVFDEIYLGYAFDRKNYHTYPEKIPRISIHKWIPEDYSAFLQAGTQSRIRLTKKILEELSKAFEQKVIIKGINEDDLEQVLEFKNIPFGNAPKTTPKGEELYELCINDYLGRIKKILFNTDFDLVLNEDPNRAGMIRYVLPTKRPNFCAHSISSSERYSEFDHDPNWRLFDLGGITFQIPGYVISNETQYELIKKMNKIKY
ncbi:hypothetical protein J4474_02145 [Candidatus Pacearchaeota archaeon]|nr:hypothetical protein [Candidatus Pacearchaeota archaeon]